MIYSVLRFCVVPFHSNHYMYQSTEKINEYVIVNSVVKQIGIVGCTLDLDPQANF